MKKKVFMACMLLLLVSLLALGKSNFFGSIKGTEYVFEESEIHSLDEIQDAMKVAKRSFVLKSGGYHLDKLLYDKDKNYKAVENIDLHKDAHEPNFEIEDVIILNFEVTLLNPRMAERRGVTYDEHGNSDDFEWTLYQNESGHWVLYNYRDV